MHDATKARERRNEDLPLCSFSCLLSFESKRQGSFPFQPKEDLARSCLHSRTLSNIQVRRTSTRRSYETCASPFQRIFPSRDASASNKARTTSEIVDSFLHARWRRARFLFFVSSSRGAFLDTFRTVRPVVERGRKPFSRILDRKRETIGTRIRRSCPFPTIERRNDALAFCAFKGSTIRTWCATRVVRIESFLPSSDGIGTLSLRCENGGCALRNGRVDRSDVGNPGTSMGSGRMVALHGVGGIFDG